MAGNLANDPAAYAAHLAASQQAAPLRSQASFNPWQAVRNASAGAFQNTAPQPLPIMIFAVHAAANGYIVEFSGQGKPSTTLICPEGTSLLDTFAVALANYKLEE